PAGGLVDPGNPPGKLGVVALVPDVVPPDIPGKLGIVALVLEVVPPDIPGKLGVVALVLEVVPPAIPGKLGAIAPEPVVVLAVTGLNAMSLEVFVEVEVFGICKLPEDWNRPIGGLVKVEPVLAPPLPEAEPPELVTPWLCVVVLPCICAMSAHRDSHPLGPAAGAPAIGAIVGMAVDNSRRPSSCSQQTASLTIA
ncbi:MAG: hypothetical protein ACLQGP_22980, partial [Isosphaeraceae bacterium]